MLTSKLMIQTGKQAIRLEVLEIPSEKGYISTTGTALFTILDAAQRTAGHPRTHDMPTGDFIHVGLFDFVKRELSSKKPRANDTKIGLELIDQYVGLCARDASFCTKEHFERFLYSYFLENNEMPSRKIGYRDAENREPIISASAQISDMASRLKELEDMERAGDVVRVYKYTVTSIEQICIATLSTLVENDMLIKRCEHCGRYFVAFGRSDTMYCEYPSPQMPIKSCRDYVPYMKWQNKLKDDDARLLYKKIYNMNANKVRRWSRDMQSEKYKQSYDLQEKFIGAAAGWQESVKADPTKYEDYIAWLKVVHKNNGRIENIEKEATDNGEHQED